MLKHVNNVVDACEEDFVLVSREHCSPLNSLFSAPRSQAEEEEYVVPTASPILGNSPDRELSYRPYPSREVRSRAERRPRAAPRPTPLRAPPCRGTGARWSPRARPQVLVQSPILANSEELRAIATLRPN